MDRFLTINNFITALRSVPPWQVLLELLVIGAAVYWVIRFLQGTRGARLLRGIITLLITLYIGMRLLGAVLDLSRLEIVFDRFLFYASFAIIIVFQPELRRALMRLGETRLFRAVGTSAGDEIEQIVDACAFLSRRRVGALIALERDEPLGGFTEEATRIDAEVTSALIQTIFWPNTALHDLGMIVSNGRIAFAGVQFPLAESGDLPRELGSRHRAAVGLSQETDAVVVVVSEETGDISIAERGQLLRRRTIDQLREDLNDKLGQSEAGAFAEPEARTVIYAPGERTRMAERGGATRIERTGLPESARDTIAPPAGGSGSARLAGDGVRRDASPTLIREAPPLRDPHAGGSTARAGDAAEERKAV